MSIYSIAQAEEAEYRLELIKIAFDKNEITFSRRMASKLVGGDYRLKKLVMEGKIEMDKPTSKQNGKWHCRASDVLKYIR